MNKYPVWWDTTLTIFNRYVDATTSLITWHRTVIHNCFWQYSTNRGVYSKYGRDESSGNMIFSSYEVVCRIPKQDNFLTRSEWEALPNDKMDDYFTLSIGDIVILGDSDIEINEYVNGQRSSDIVAKYKKFNECTEIRQVGIRVGRGRVNEHYYVAGE